MTKSYNITFQLWDTSQGADMGELVIETKPQVISVLREIQDLYDAFFRAQKQLTGLDPQPVKTASLRVSMSRNDGAGILRVTLKNKDKTYSIHIRSEAGDGQGLLGVLYRRWTRSFNKPRINMYPHDNIEGAYWIEMTVDDKCQASQSAVTGLHPITGALVTAQYMGVKPGPLKGTSVILYGVPV